MTTSTPRRRWLPVVAVAATLAGATVRQLPGLGAVAATFAGVLLLAGLGWALLALVPYLLLLAYELNGRGGR